MGRERDRERSPTFSLQVGLSEIAGRMSWSGYVWSEPPSMTAMKYHRQPRVGRPLQPGERFSVAREMESSVRGYKEVSRDLSVARRNVQWEDRRRISASMERTPPATYYKSVVGTRSAKGAGGIYFCEIIGRSSTFSNSTRRF